MRPAKPSDFDAFYQGVPRTSRAWAMERDGEVLALGGVYYEKGKAIAFSEFRGDIGKKDRWRGAQKVMEIVRTVEGPVYAKQGPFESAPKVLSRLGFQPLPDSEYWYWRPN